MKINIGIKIKQVEEIKINFCTISFQRVKWKNTMDQTALEITEANCIDPFKRVS